MVWGIADLLKNVLFMALLARDSGVLFFYIKLTVLFLTKISNMNLKQSQMGTLDEKATTEFSRALTWVFSRVLYFSKWYKTQLWEIHRTWTHTFYREFIYFLVLTIFSCREHKTYIILIGRTATFWLKRILEVYNVLLSFMYTFFSYMWGGRRGFCSIISFYGYTHL